MGVPYSPPLLPESFVWSKRRAKSSSVMSKCANAPQKDRSVIGFLAHTVQKIGLKQLISVISDLISHNQYFSFIWHCEWQSVMTAQL